MEGWQQDWWKMLETVAEEIERFVTDVVEELEAATDALIGFTEEVAEQVERSLTPTFDEADDTLDDWIDPLLAFLNGIEATMGEVVSPVTHTVEPMLNQHPACVGCRHYHGQSYGGTTLVCGMHPYGWEDEKCPDWESTWPHSEN
ncbi:hypothetical protein [Microcoleus sp. FACHB-1515]|uniref:hypothetical protein n=1 Tax=Cyanophyceae TaxID=3028117 RepID=UPI001687CE10|nr:hypothetical protein [Microcoleus sp. FACHB-1515]